MSVLQIGAGSVGWALTHKLAQNNDVVGDIVLASRTESKCQSIIDSVHRKKNLKDESRSLSSRTVDADNPDALQKLIEEIKPDLVVNVGPPPINVSVMEQALDGTIDLVARHSIIVQHPHCAAHLHTPPAIPALAAELIISALNQSMDSWDQASAATHIEMQTVDWFARRFGMGEHADGTFTSGGTQSNFMGLLLARDEICKRTSGHHVFSVGLPDYASRMRVITSRTTHFSIVKSLAQLGLGSRAVVAVDCDEAGRMVPAAFSIVLVELE